MSRRKQAVGRVSSGRGRTGRQANLTGESASDKPDASRQRRSTSEGINAATTDSSACNSSPTPQFSTAGENYQGKKIEKIEHNNLQQPVDGSSPKSNEEAYDIGRRARLWNPSTRRTTTSPTSHVTHRGRPGSVTRRRSTRDPATASDLAPVERTPTPDNTHR